MWEIEAQVTNKCVIMCYLKVKVIVKGEEYYHHLTFCDNLMCQLTWATGCPDIWSHCFGYVREDVFWMRLTIKSVNFE